MDNDETTLPDRLYESDAVPEEVGSYRIRRRLGSGGMGVVYEAEQPVLRRRVALKLIRPDKHSAATVRRFVQESEILGRLQHPGIAQIFDAGMLTTPLGEQPYFAMELVQGEALDQYAKHHGLGTRARLEQMIKVAEAVAHAHAKGVIHRDLKPTNILVDPTGQPKVLDFGVARVMPEQMTELSTLSSYTQAGTLLGTLAYMSPEQTRWSAQALDARSDVYSLGVIAFQLLADRLPYDLAGRGQVDAVLTIRNVEPVRLGHISPHFAGDLEVVIGKALEKDGAARYQSAQAFADELKRVVDGLPIQASPPSPWVKARRWMLREERIRQTGLAIMVMFLVVGLFEVFWIVVGLAVVLGLASPLSHARWGIFTLQALVWLALMAAGAYVNWGVVQGRRSALWASFFLSLGYFLFALLVASDVVPYTMGGTLDDKVLRLTLFSFFSALALMMVAINLLALITFYTLRRRAESDHEIVLQQPANSREPRRTGPNRP